jgi:hypothetical protein
VSDAQLGAHWFDRLTARATRRTALKAGVVAAAALVMPFKWPSAASADIHTEDCFWGCRWFEHKQFGVAKANCASLDTNLKTNQGFSLAASIIVLPAGVIANVVGQLASINAYHSCLDTAITNAKVASFDCYGPDCGGFDPKQAGGPCDSCTENCCVCPDIPSGYICCFYSCDDENHNCCGS